MFNRIQHLLYRRTTDYGTYSVIQIEDNYVNKHQGIEVRLFKQGSLVTKTHGFKNLDEAKLFIRDNAFCDEEL